MKKPVGNFGMFKSNESSLFDKDEDKIKSAKKDKPLDTPFNIKQLKKEVMRLALQNKRPLYS